MRVSIHSGAVEIETPAKINLFLEVLRKREDGYHEIETVMQAVNLCDTVTVHLEGRGITVECDASELPTDERNLAYRAAMLVKQETGKVEGVRIEIKKRIPWGMGLGGGSSDAAAVIVALDILWKIAFSHADRVSIGARLGADVPFFLTCGTALCRGIGEDTCLLSGFPKLWYVLICSETPLSTRRVYSALSDFDMTDSRESAIRFIEKTRNGDSLVVGKALFNRLEAPAFRLEPGLARVKKAMSEVGFHGILMTGSGAGLYGVCQDHEHAERAAASLSERIQGRIFCVATWEPVVGHSQNINSGLVEATSFGQ